MLTDFHNSFADQISRKLGEQLLLLYLSLPPRCTMNMQYSYSTAKHIRG